MFSELFDGFHLNKPIDRLWLVEASETLFVGYFGNLAA